MNGMIVVCLAAMLVVAGMAGCGAVAGGYQPNQLYCCGGKEVWLVDVDQARRDPSARLWTWTAADSPQILPQHRECFGAMDDCKPAGGGKLLFVSSSSTGAIAVIRIADKACLFYAAGRNAHSMELIAGKVVAGAFSQRSDELRLFAYPPTSMPAKPVWSMPLSWAHGAVWDRSRQVLWVLGDKELLQLRVTFDPIGAEVVKKWDLPKAGGHDLFPYDAEHLTITVNSAAYLFDIGTGQFGPVPGLEGQQGIKSLNRHPLTGQIGYTQAAGNSSFTDHINVLNAAPASQPTNRLYKVRWNAPNPFSYAP